MIAIVIVGCANGDASTLPWLSAKVGVLEGSTSTREVVGAFGFGSYFSFLCWMLV